MARTKQTTKKVNQAIEDLEEEENNIHWQQRRQLKQPETEWWVERNIDFIQAQWLFERLENTKSQQNSSLDRPHLDGLFERYFKTTRQTGR